MIYFLILIDIIIANYTKYNTYFFIIYLYNKKYKDYLLTALILDIIIFQNIYNLIILTIIYFLNKLFHNLNKNNIAVYLLINTFNYTMYIILSNILTFTTINNILLKIGLNIPFSLLFYILSYKENKIHSSCI